MLTRCATNLALQAGEDVNQAIPLRRSGPMLSRLCAAVICAALVFTSVARAAPANSSSPEPEAPSPSWPTVDCVLGAADAYGLPPIVLLGIMRVEGGRPGHHSGNKNGTYDIGPMQINSWWLSRLKQAGITEAELANNGCLNMWVGAAILALALKEADGNLAKAVGYYHSHKRHLAVPYKNKVRDAITGFLQQQNQP